MAFITSPNMGLEIPGVGTEPGPQFAFEVNYSLNLVDLHDHSPGRGVQITPAGLDINANLNFQNNSITNLGSLVLENQTSISTLMALYVKPGSEIVPINDLWYNDSAGNAIQLTSAGAVNATIANLPGESYAAGTFTWKQGTGSTTPANFDIGSITIRPTTAATTNGVTVTPPSGISSAYNVALPPLPVSATSFLAIDTSGNTSVPTPIVGTGRQYLQTPPVGSSPVWTSFATPTIQVLSGSGTYTAPTGALYIKVKMVGSGGGGGGATSPGTNGTATTFRDWSASGGFGGPQVPSSNTAGSGGAGSAANTVGTGTAVINTVGGMGTDGEVTGFGGGTGGSSYFGSGGYGATTTNSGGISGASVPAASGVAFGSGGGGGNGFATEFNGAGGGGAGGYLEFIITSPTSYSYSVPAGGGTGGNPPVGGGSVAGTGAAGYAVVEAYFQ